MRKVLLISVAAFGTLLVILAAFVAYAVTNLNGIIKAERGFLLAKASDAVGREVQAQEITASLGWGVALDITGLKVADDPSFSQVPFLQANEVLGQVEFVPLLRKEVKVTRFDLKQPEVRVLRDRYGVLNITTLGRRPAAGQNLPPAPELPGQKPSGPGAIRALAISSLIIEGGQILYQDLGSREPPLKVGSLDLDVENFSALTPFDVKLALAAFAETPNLTLSGRIGPLIQGGIVDFASLPVAAQITAGPLLLDRLRTISALRDKIPPKLQLSQPVSLRAKLDGNLQALAFDLNTDLTQDRVVYRGVFDKPAGIAARIAARGSRRAGTINVERASLNLADLEAKLAQIELGANAISARVDTNRFDVGAISRTLPAAASYGATGRAEIHTNLRIVASKPEFNGLVTLSEVALKSAGHNLPPLSGVTGSIRLAGNSAVVEPTSFTLGSTHANLEARAESIEPLRASYVLKADAVNLHAFLRNQPPDRTEELRQLALAGTVAGPLSAPELTARLTSAFAFGSGQGQLQARAESVNPLRASYSVTADTLSLKDLVPSRSPDEQLHGISVNGTASGSTSAPELAAAMTSSDGLVAAVPYRNLALTANYGRDQLLVRSLKLDAYGGAIAASVGAALGAAPAFNLTLNTTGIDLEQALKAQQAKAADTIRGRLTSQLRVSGRGSNFDAIKPTLQGNGRVSIADGKLVGVNLAAQALNKINGIPGIDTLFTPAIAERHPALFRDPDTELKLVDLSFVLSGPRLTSNDVRAQSIDYQVLAQGWFDMDKNVDLGAHILMSKQFTTELEAEKKNVVYITNPEGEIDIPLIIRGVLPKPSILPDLQYLIQRAATHAVQKQGEKLLNKFLEKKGLGGVFGAPENAPAPGGPGPGVPAPGAGAPAAQPTPVNPFAPFSKLLGGGANPSPGASPTPAGPPNPLAPFTNLLH